MNAGRKIVLGVLVSAAAAAGLYCALLRPPAARVLTGVVTTDEVIVAPEIQGRLQNLYVQQGDTVTNGELLAQIQPEQWQADTKFYARSQQESAADLAQAKADLENARLSFARIQDLYSNHVESAQADDVRGPRTIRRGRTWIRWPGKLKPWARRNKRPRSICNTRKFSLPPTASWTRAPPCRARW